MRCVSVGLDAAAKKLIRQSVLTEEARDERQQVQFHRVSAGRPGHVSHVEYADHLRPELDRC